MDRHAALLVRPFNHDLGHRRLLELLGQRVANFHVLVQELAVLVLARIPPRVPRAVDTETQTCRIDLLTHRGLLRRSPRSDEPRSSDARTAWESCRRGRGRGRENA